MNKHSPLKGCSPACKLGRGLKSFPLKNKYVTKCYTGPPNWTDLWNDLELKWNLEKYGLRQWTGFNWVRIVTSGMNNFN
jgi:hypothetical protein